MDRRVNKNIFVGVSCRFLILAMGIFLPRLVMLSFGSEANGLLNTITQIFTYVALLEAGIGNATLNALYEPLSSGDRNKTLQIMASSQSLFRKTTALYMLLVGLLTVMLPFIIRSELSKRTIALVTLLQGMSGASGYYLTAAYKQLLAADGRNYYSENAQLLTHVCSTAGKIVLIQLGANIVLLQILNFAVTMVGILFLRLIVKKQYPWLKTKGIPQTYKLKDRSAFVVHELAATVFSCTDVVVISAMCGLAASSVYSVYNLVYSSLQMMLTTVATGTMYLIGQAYHKGHVYFQKMYDVYDRLYIFLVFSVMIVAVVLTGPFVALYTAGITDAHYQDQLLPFLFALVVVLSSCRQAASRAIAVAGHVKKTQGRAILETAINLTFSIAMVFVFGIRGALYGTIAALLYRTTDMIIYANHKILKRSCKKSVFYIAAWFGLAAIEILALHRIAGTITSYWSFACCGLAMLLVTLIVNAVVAGFINWKDISWMIKQGRSTESTAIANED